MNNYDENLRTEYSGASFYGNYRTRTFGDIFSDYNENIYTSSENYFTSLWENSPFADTVKTEDIQKIFYLLYARYGNSSIASSDENRFVYQLHSIIFQYAPTWAKELTVQKEIRNLSINELRKGPRMIANNALNPSSAPSTQDTEELPFVSAQNVSKTERNVADGYALLLSLLKSDVSEKFLKKFERLFITVVQPSEALWYLSDQYY